MNPQINVQKLLQQFKQQINHINDNNKCKIGYHHMARGQLDVQVRFQMEIKKRRNNISGEGNTLPTPSIVLSQSLPINPSLYSSSMGLSQLPLQLFIAQCDRVDFVEQLAARDIGQIGLEYMGGNNKNSKSNSQMNPQQVSQQLGDFMHTTRLSLRSLSNHNIATISQLDDLTGDIVALSTIPLPSHTKLIAQVDQALKRSPHQIRVKRKVAKTGEVTRRKTKQEILDQLKIIEGLMGGVGKMGRGMANNNSLQGSDNNNPYEPIRLTKQIQQQQINEKQLVELLSTLTLSQDHSYSDFWQALCNKLRLDTNTKRSEHAKLLDDNINDQQFRDAIERIVKEATEYQMEAKGDSEDDEDYGEQGNQEGQEDNGEQQQQQGNHNDPTNMHTNGAPPTVNNQQAPAAGFQSVRIAPKTSTSNNSTKFPHAIEDSCDLTDFYDLLPKEKFAFNFSFQLDQFQKRSVLHLERRESVFVAAHTSAGKTVIAQYGIALALRSKRKVIYTSPIKALSNQKYRELSKKFPSVGIVTGDISINQNAGCVVMTTEILRNNLYRGAQMIRELEWVIFDEVHYINNKERGVVWEETIIMLPQSVGIIMLSATVPNYMEFANWVGRTKRRIIYVMKTLHRPVPLEHSLFIMNKFHVIKEPNGPFLREEYSQLKHIIQLFSRKAQDVKEALQVEKRKKLAQKGFYNDNRRQQRLKIMNKQAVDKFIKKISRSDMDSAESKQDYRVLGQLIADCAKKQLLPCVVFTFSKRKINQFAQKLYTNDLNNRFEKSKITRVIAKALSNLKQQDRDLDQFHFIRKICLNGYAIHHGDLLPLAKQIVELLFSDGLIKVLFATQTFAMGINMPAKTVIFDSIKKVDGVGAGMRFLNSSQYVQMSGRAGRRGLDEKGTVIVVVKDPSNIPDINEMSRMIDHPGEMLRSKFRVTYQIILNLFNAKDFGVTEMMRQSFFEDPKFSELTSNIRKVKDSLKAYQRLSEFDCPFNRMGTRLLIEEYLNTAQMLRRVNGNIFGALDFNKRIILPKFITLLDHHHEEHIGLLLKIDNDMRHRGRQRCAMVMVVAKIYTGFELDGKDLEAEKKKLGIKKRIVLQYDNSTATPEQKEINGPVAGCNNQYFFNVYWVRLEDILNIYTNKLNSKAQVDVSSKQSLQQIANQLVSPSNKLIPMVFNATQLAKTHGQDLQLQGAMQDELKKSNCHNCPQKVSHQTQQIQRFTYKRLAGDCAKLINANDLGMMGSFEGMLKLLRTYGFIKDEILTLKGRIARQVDIYVTQVLVEAVLDNLNEYEIACLLSAFVCDYKPRRRDREDTSRTTDVPEIELGSQALEEALHRTKHIMEQLVEAQLSCESYIGVSSSSDLISGLLNFSLCEPVYLWAIGYDFREAIHSLDIPQGIVVKTILRLNMLLGNVKSVCRVMGNDSLEKKICFAGECIRRDIIFCQSLYLSE